MFDDAEDALDELEHEESTLSPQARARRETAGEGLVVLADISKSMEDPAGFKARKSRWSAVDEALVVFRPIARVIVFQSESLEIQKHTPLPRPGGGTNVAGAIEHATRLRPARTVLICDGEPTDAYGEVARGTSLAFGAARRLPGILDTIFVGDENDQNAKKFMEDLARECGGTYRDLATPRAQRTAAYTGNELTEALSELLLPP
jgi:Mg-chelatase subunit ChlD